MLCPVVGKVLHPRLPKEVGLPLVGLASQSVEVYVDCYVDLGNVFC